MAKGFLDVAENLISTANTEEVTVENKTKTPPVVEGVTIKKYNKEKPESKSRRVSLLIKPSVYEIIKAEADEVCDGKVNELINYILDQYVVNK